ncbi:NEL-type E3 ubiquitin ligase domain-containing protein [Pseudomonas sp. RA_35y_Pfl2_P32]|uniref:NEL-type E3 ubiquitin ligase domain-containing protein n=1 Tax=Pseudomonas sp. RA_35y_Pfl2_P32 TaxID=3088705 RepID=UPI0030DA55B7
MTALALNNKSKHHDFIKKVIPDWLKKTSPSRVNELKSAPLRIPQWNKAAPASAHLRLQGAIKDHWATQNDVDQALSSLQDVQAFAEPLLKKALKDRYGIEVDVKQTWLRLYAPAATSWWTPDFASAVTSRTISLLDAALHNFATHESFTHDSEFITQPDARGHFLIKPLKPKISIEQFKSLCRELDIGAQYQQHLKAVLLPSDSVASSTLQHKIILSQKSALKAAAHLALMKKDISQSAYEVVQGTLDKRKNLKWNGNPVSYCNLAMMDTSLTGIILMVCGASTSAEPERLIAYIPHDPEHPLKEYASSIEFMTELTRQLRDSPASKTPTSTGLPLPQSYQQFFSQFVAHEQRGYFFSRLNERLSKVTWHPAVPGSDLPSWRETAVDKPDLQFSVTRLEDDRRGAFDGDLWRYCYQQTLNKILNDAREIAISTSYVDRMARWAWWDNLEKMLSDILNVALLVVTPFVPFLGELMLAYTAYQLTDGVFEGIVDWAEGHGIEAGGQALGVLEDMVQLGIFAAGANIAGSVRLKLSPFVENLKPITLPDGQRRLWNPDLSPYLQSDLVLPLTSEPDAHGVHQYQGKQILPLDNQYFEVKKDPNTSQYTLKHPQRPHAYAPALKHNGHGAWVSEVENPRQWEGTQLMRRLGHSIDTYSDSQLERIRQISGTEEAVLRRMHLDSAAPPPLLVDTLQRLAPDAPASTAPMLDANAKMIQQHFPDLPPSVVEKVLADITPLEQQRISEQSLLPLRLKTRAREMQFETEAVRAAQGLYKDSLVNLDTERLVLGSLRTATDLFGDLRIEIRQATLAGALRCSAGPDDATHVRVLIRNDAGQYEAQDADGSIIHSSDNLYESILHALPAEKYPSLGYRPGDGEPFKEWVIAKTAPAHERRTLLAKPPIRPVAEHETQLLLRGPTLSRLGVTLHERIQDLHPHFSESEVNAFANALIARGEPFKAMDTLENDLDELRVILNRWQYQQPDAWGPDSKGFRNGGGQHIAERLIDCFERTHTELGNRTDPSSYSLDLSRELLPLDLQLWWSKIPPELRKFLDRVKVLKLDNTRFSAESSGLLKDFPNLRELSAKGCELTRLPNGIGAMHRLERLRLSANRMVLDTPAVEQLKQLTYLQILRMDDNPLALLPNIARMPRLKVVSLKNTGASTWPDGTFARPRPRGFLLNLQGNPISQLPDVVPGSENAWVLARTRVDVGSLSELNQVLYQKVRRSCALPPEPVVTAENQPSLVIVSGYSDLQWSDVPGWGIDRSARLSEVESEPGAEAFMDLLTQTRESADYRAGGDAQAQLMQRAWRMLDAVHTDNRLRQTLFTMASAPVDCADAGAQVFNHMGIQVLAAEAHLYSTDPAQLEQKLVTLAKGAARLEQVNDIARSDIDSRSGNPDDVEVYLAYQTGLAERLDLPWQSRGMLYRPVSGVTDAMIDQAFETVQALGEGDGLVNRMLEQGFWQTYLHETYPVQLENNTQLYQLKSEQLETLRTTQHEWVNSTQLTELQRAGLRARLNELMNDLPVPPTVVFTDEPMSTGAYERLQVDLGYEEKELSRRLTRTALRRAEQ